jgi:hypothetical protein
LCRRQEVKQSLLRQRENLETVRERMEAELRLILSEKFIEPKTTTTQVIFVLSVLRIG